MVIRVIRVYLVMFSIRTRAHSLTHTHTEYKTPELTPTNTNDCVYELLGVFGNVGDYMFSLSMHVCALRSEIESVSFLGFTLSSTSFFNLFQETMGLFYFCFQGFTSQRARVTLIYLEKNTERVVVMSKGVWGSVGVGERERLGWGVMR